MAHFPGILCIQKGQCVRARNRVGKAFAIRNDEESKGVIFFDARHDIAFALCSNIMQQNA
jgi:hypothetical protein